MQALMTVIKLPEKNGMLSTKYKPRKPTGDYKGY